MAGFGDLGSAIGLALGGGDMDLEGARLEGLNTGSQINARNAQTQNAMAQARQRTDEARRLAEIEKQADTLADQLGIPRELVISGLAGVNPQQFTGAASDIQGQGFRSTIADAGLPFADRQAAAQAVSGKPLNASDFLGPGGELFMDVFNPSAAGTTATPTGTAQIGADNALAADRLASAALDDEKRLHPDRFRDSTTVNVGGFGLGDDLLNPKGALNLGDDVGNVFGAAGAVGSKLNTLTDMLPGVSLAFPDIKTAEVALNTLRNESMAAVLEGFPGRQTNWLSQRIDSEFPTPAALFQGEEGALTSIVQLRDLVSRELEAQKQLLPRFQTKSAYDKGLGSVTRMAQTVADFNQVIDAMQGSDSDWVTTPSGVRFRKIQ